MEQKNENKIITEESLESIESLAPTQVVENQNVASTQQNESIKAAETAKPQISVTPSTPPPKAQEKEGFADPLLDCLVILTHLNEHPVSPNALIAGLPLVKNRLTPQLFIRAAQRVGFASRIMQRPLKKISKLVLPSVLLLKNDRACILNKICSDDPNYVEIIIPDSGAGTARISLDDLREDYTGFAIFLKPVLQFEQRAEEFNIETKKSWFWGTLWEYRNIYLQVIIAALFINIFSLASPLFVMNVYNRVVPYFAVETLWVLSIGMVVIIGFELLIRTLRAYLIDLAGKKADTIMASTLFHQALNLKMSSKPASSGAFASNFREFETLRDFFTSVSVTTLVDLPFLFLFVAMTFMIGGAIGFIPLIAMPIIFLGAYFMEIPIHRAIETSMFATNQKQAILVEAINNLETIKSSGAEGTLLRKWEQYIGIAAQAGLKARFFSTLAINFTAFASQMLTVVIIIVGVYLIAQHKLTLGGLIACMILEGRILAPLSQMAALLTRFNQSKMALTGLNKVMELPVERPENHKFLHKPTFTDSLEFHNVSLKYTEKGQHALKNVSFKIKVGEHVAILGRMGSGKSTLEKMIMRLYEPCEGAIFVDGIDIAQIDPSDIRRNIGYVSQDYSMLYGTVYENIALSMPYSGDQQVLQAAKLAGVDEFIQRHPDGFGMNIGEHGAGLSGGQRQAVALARALLTGPPILLLDEPTSSIDARAEALIIQNLAAYTANKTLILVTHKPTLLNLVNRIIILDNGQVVADGPKDQVLMALQNNQVTTPHA